MTRLIAVFGAGLLVTLLSAAVGGGGAAAQTANACPESGSVCTETLTPSCLSRIGAGALSQQAVGADCEADLRTYLDCVADIAERCPSAAPEPAAASGDALLRRNFLSALARELEGNLDTLDALAERMDLTGGTSLYENDWPRLRTRFFEATDNPAYFYAPAEWLGDTQEFYDHIAGVLENQRVRDVYRRGVTSTLYDRRLIKEDFLERLADARKRLLPLIQTAAAE